MKIKSKPTESEIIESLRRSGYLLESECKLPLKLGHQGLEFFGFSNTLSTKRHPSMVE